MDTFLLLMKELADTLELQLPEFDKNKEVLLVFDDLPVLFHFNQQNSLITLDANLGRSGGRDRLPEILLMASNEWRTRNLWFSICPETQSVHLQRVIPLETYPEFESSLQRFVETALQWQQAVVMRTGKSALQLTSSININSFNNGIRV